MPKDHLTSVRLRNIKQKQENWKGYSSPLQQFSLLHLPFYKMARSFSGVSRVNTGELGPRFKFVLLTEPVAKGLFFVCACSCENAQHHTLLEATRWRHFSLRGVRSGVHVLFFLSGRRSLIHSCCVLPVFSFLVRISGWEPVACLGGCGQCVGGR